MSGQSLGMGLGENSAARWGSLLHCHLSPDSPCYGRKWGTDEGLLPCIPSYGQRSQWYCTNKHCHGLLRNKSPCIAEKIDIHQILLKYVLCPPKLPNVLHERTFLINDVPGSRGNMVKQKQMLDPVGAPSHKQFPATSVETSGLLFPGVMKCHAWVSPRHCVIVSSLPSLDWLLLDTKGRKGVQATTTPTADVDYRHNRAGQAKNGHKTTWE